MHITAHTYSMISKSLQIAALVFLFFLISSKACAHVDLIDFSSIEMERKIDNKQENDRQKEMDRQMNPDLSSKERDARDREIDNGSRGTV